MPSALLCASSEEKNILIEQNRAACGLPDFAFSREKVIMGNGRTQCPFPAETAALWADGCYPITPE